MRGNSRNPQTELDALRRLYESADSKIRELEAQIGTMRERRVAWVSPPTGDISDLARALETRHVRMGNRQGLLRDLSAFNSQQLAAMSFEKWGATIMMARAQTGKSAAIAYLMYKALAQGLCPIVLMNTNTKLPMREFVLKKVQPFNAQYGIGMDVDGKSIIAYGTTQKEQQNNVAEFCARLCSGRPCALLIQADVHQLSMLKAHVGGDDVAARRACMEKCAWIMDEAHDFSSMQLLTDNMSLVDDSLNAKNEEHRGAFKQAEQVLMQLLGRWETTGTGDSAKRRLVEVYPHHIVMVSATSEDVAIVNDYYGLRTTVLEEDVAKNDACGYRGHEKFRVCRLLARDFEHEESHNCYYDARKFYLNSADHNGKASKVAHGFKLVSAVSKSCIPAQERLDTTKQRRVVCADWALVATREHMHPRVRSFMEGALQGPGSEGNTLLEPLGNTTGVNSAYNHALFVKRNFSSPSNVVHALVVCGGDPDDRPGRQGIVPAGCPPPGGVYEVLDDGRMQPFPDISAAFRKLNACLGRRLWIGSTVADKSLTLGVDGFPVTHMVYFDVCKGARLSTVNQLVNRMATYQEKKANGAPFQPTLLIDSQLYDDLVCMYRAGGISDKILRRVPLTPDELVVLQRHPIGHADNTHVPRAVRAAANRGTPVATGQNLLLPRPPNEAGEADDEGIKKRREMLESDGVVVQKPKRARKARAESNAAHSRVGAKGANTAVFEETEVNAQLWEELHGAPLTPQQLADGVHYLPEVVVNYSPSPALGNSITQVMLRAAATEAEHDDCVKLARTAGMKGLSTRMGVALRETMPAPYGLLYLRPGKKNSANHANRNPLTMGKIRDGDRSYNHFWWYDEEKRVGVGVKRIRSCECLEMPFVFHLRVNSGIRVIRVAEVART